MSFFYLFLITVIGSFLKYLRPTSKAHSFLHAMEHQVLCFCAFGFLVVCIVAVWKIPKWSMAQDGEPARHQ